ncbi:NAD-glutamate dehydrogenase [Polymorphobacter sp.]|uniref:NAD-glutamate dehydrogenase n=1 Tax=Polymorphobacter sp. TaxID=1909290 RepID=UPI003F72DBA2
MQSARTDAMATVSIADILFNAALPDERDGLDAGAREAIARRVEGVVATREAGVPLVRLEPAEPGAGRPMALIIVNDDKPFLVDSVAAAVTAAGIESVRLLHPVFDVRRHDDGRLLEVAEAGPGPAAAGWGRESLIYIELKRANAKARAELVESVRALLADIACVVADWQPMRAALLDAAQRLGDHSPPVAPEAAAEMRAFLAWLAADSLTLLGVRHWTIDASGTPARTDEGALGLLRDPDYRLWGSQAAPDWRAAIAASEPVSVTRAGTVNRVHRRTQPDLIAIKGYDAQGRLVRLTCILGLLTSEALATSPRQVPLVRRKVAQVVEALGFVARSHNGKALAHVLENFPRQELFEASASQLEEMALGTLSLLDRPRPRLFARVDSFGRSLSVLVHVPHGLYALGVRERISAMLAEATGGTLSRHDVELHSEGLARIHLVFSLPQPGIELPGEAALNEQLLRLLRGWDEGLEAALLASAGPTRAARLRLSHGRAFSASYRAQHSPDEAAQDTLVLAGLEDDSERAVRLFPLAEGPAGQFRLKIYRLGPIIPLSEIVPALENFGLRVIEEFPFDLAGGQLGRIHDVVLEVDDPGLLVGWPALEARLAPALRGVLGGSAESDRFNALVVHCRLTLEEAGWLRAWFRYLRQAGATYGIATVVEALCRMPALCAGVVRLFRLRFGPDVVDRAHAEAAQRETLEAGLADVSSLDDDRILRLFMALVGATLRTNAFVPGGPEALAMKLDSSAVPGLPPPVPYREIWVHSPRVEGIHLRGGPIARGGLRWSDRRDDFRTEVLGLVKAQMVKNAVIVPTGAKGGFYAKKLPPPGDRAAWLLEGTEAYRIFIRALLSLTDNLAPDGRPIPPEGIVCHDAPDPYLVVAADKGTASFSDTANAIALGQDFWLGDAFASGGSQGYDHKAMGITARGAWLSVERHGRELGLDVARDPVRTIGVGDMSGDVFGNGMLLSRAIRLVAAFDHRHIFLDPAPGEAAFAERQRLFALPASSWDDYDRTLISTGGGVFPRSLKAVPLSQQVQAMIGSERASMAPAELIQALLRAPVDLLWFGGIGTYVKASHQSHAEVGDRATDALRVDAHTLRARIVGEGANLGLTQAARIAFARGGGRINTDFIDNSAGVDCSDHEVNIKIALGAEVAAGRLAPADRDLLLASMTDDVARLVLTNNRLQAQAISLAEQGGAGAVPRYQRLMAVLAETAGLDLKIEGLPDAAESSRRSAAGEGLTRPELAVLMAYAKMALTAALAAPGARSLIDDVALFPDLLASFPPAMAARFAPALEGHRLRPELIATRLANQLVNRLGPALPFELAEASGASLVQMASAFVAARDLFALPSLWAALDDGELPAADQLRLHGATVTALAAHVADLLSHARDDGAGDTVRRLAGPLATLSARLATAPHRPHGAEALPGPEDLVARIRELAALDGAIGLASASVAHGHDVGALANAYARLGAETGLDWAHGAALALLPADLWERRLQASLSDSFERLRLEFLARLPGDDPEAALADWLAAHRQAVDALFTLAARARTSATASPAMLALFAEEARRLLG